MTTKIAESKFLLKDVLGRLLDLGLDLSSTSVRITNSSGVRGYTLKVIDIRRLGRNLFLRYQDKIWGEVSWDVEGFYLLSGVELTYKGLMFYARKS